MTRRTLISTMAAFLAISFANAQELEISQFGGDVKLACEAVLCLSSATHPAACSPALQRYFSIRGKRAAQERLNFLNLCPAASSSPEMQSLTSALVSGSGQCSIATLNQTHVWIGSIGGEGNQLGISNQIPPGCAAYYANPIIAAGLGEDEKPAYVGSPEMGGYWVSQKDYPSALADYTRQLELRKNNNMFGGN